MSYESPLEVIFTEFASKVANQMDNDVWQAIQRVGIDVDKDELIRALQYDRDQYQKGYNDGYENGLNADKWISVEDGLPEIGKVVLAFGTRSATTGMFQGVLSGRPDVWMWKNHTPKHVSHWMPLPPPPPKEG